MSERAPVIVGGGIAGAAAACHLAAAGARPLLIERRDGPHDKVCGEFLSVETVAMLRALGVDPLALGARPIGHVRVVHGTRAATTALPFRALSLSRRVLDEALLARAAALGVTVERGRAVTHADAASAGGALFVATGKHVLRGVARPPGGGLTGLKMYFRLAPAQAAALDDHVELVLFPGGYAGLQRVEGDRANLCLLTRDPAAGPAAAIAAAPWLARRLEGAEALLTRPLAAAALPYGWVAPARAPAPGRYLLGDQFAMIPSFTGDGMGIALATARLAAAAYGSHGPAGADAYAERARSLLKAQVRRATRIAGAALLPGLAPAIVAALRTAPALARWAASATRVATEPARA